MQDHLYTTVALVNGTGSGVEERYEYDAYGNCHVLEPNFAPDPDGISDYGNPYLFTASSLDILDNGSLKLQDNRNRYYDQYTGRWFTHDPLGITPNAQLPNRFGPLDEYKDTLNLYEVVGSNPITNVDPSGLLLPGPFPGPGIGSVEQLTKESMYLFARTVLIRDEHWRKLLKAWYTETPADNPVIHDGSSYATVRDIRASTGFRLLLNCWVARNIGCFEEIPENGVHFKIHEKYFWWHYYYPDNTVPGGLAAYTDATDFLGSYTAYVTAKRSDAHSCYVDVDVTVKNTTSWESACRTPKFFRDKFGGILPDYPSHNRGAGPFTPSTGGDFYQRYIFKVEKVPVNQTYGTMMKCLGLR